MEYRKLGKTGLEVGIIGLGGEYLEYTSERNIVSVIHEAIDHQINYFDLFMASPDTRNHYGEAFRNRRDKVIIAGHLGSAFKDGQYYKTRDWKISESFFEDLLRRLKSDYIDILMIHFVDELDDFEKIVHSGGLMLLAHRFKEEGKARFIGMSSHKAPVSIKAIESGLIDVLMYPVNPVYDALPGETAWPYGTENLLSGAHPSRIDLYQICEKANIGLVAMKPFSGGRLIREDAFFPLLSPIQCLYYALSRPGVCTVVPGCKNIHELRDAIQYLHAPQKKMDFSSLYSTLMKNYMGHCIFCNHCLPCPSSIDIAEVARLVHSARIGRFEIHLDKYKLLSAKGSDCTKCGNCLKRCPFDVEVIEIMNQAVEIFEINSIHKIIKFLCSNLIPWKEKIRYSKRQLKRIVKRQ